MNWAEVKRAAVLIDLNPLARKEKVQCSKLFWRCSSNFGFKLPVAAPKVITLGHGASDPRIDSN
ncbi:hypothetical protein CK218_14800 [Mesorhizobium sp. WSM3879]|nr:hypothetical protein CK218_14800 [Mesorhizobium sp. WSM3879]